MLTLYHAHHSTCSQKVRVVLAEKNLEWHGVFLDLGKKDQLQPTYLKLNPNGVVPTLVDDGDVIIDSSVICEYLDERYNGPQLTPASVVDRAHMRSWLRYIEEVPTTAIRVPSFNSAFLDRYTGLTQQAFEAEQVNARTIRKPFYQRMGTPQGFSQAQLNGSLEQLGDTCARMNRALENGPWLLGEAFTLADVAVIPTIDRMADLGLSHIWTATYPNVASWYARFQDRASFSATFYPGARVSEFLRLRPL